MATKKAAASARGVGLAKQGDRIRLSTQISLAGDGVQIDREAGTLKNVSIITRGPAVGHGFDVDDIMLSQVADAINRKADGVSVNLEHQPRDVFSPPPDMLTSLVGHASNTRIDGEHVRGDVAFGQYAKRSPRGNLWDFLFDIAEDERARKKVGLSIVFVAAPFEERQDANDQSLPPAGRVEDVLSVDFVGDPGANPNGLLSRKTPGAGPTAPSRTSLEEGAMKEALKKYLMSIGLKADATDEQATEFLAGLEGEQKVIADALAADPAPPAEPEGEPEGEPEDDPKDDGLSAKHVTEALSADRKRLQALRGLATQCGFGPEWAMDEYAKGTTVTQARKAALEMLAGQRKPLPMGAGPAIPHVSLGTDHNRDTLAPAITDAILLRAGRPMHQVDAKTNLAVRDGRGVVQLRKAHDRSAQFHHLSLLDMGRHYLAAIGVPDAFILSRTRVAELVLSRNRLMRSYGALAQGTSDFPYILEDAMGKSLRAAYEESPRTWTIWARRATNSDFKDIKRTALSEAPDLEARGEGEEIKYATLGDSREVYALAEYARGIILTRKAIINDDLDAFSRVPQMQAAAAGRKEDDVAYAILTANAAMADGVALFYASHSNLAGTSGAPATATLNAARAAMRTQTGPGGATLNLIPKFLIGPAALEGTIRQLLVSEVDPSATAVNVQNTWQNGLTPVIEPRLDATVDADTDAATWYLAADPNQIDTIEVCFLEDEQVPQLKQETEFDTGDHKYAVTHVVAAKAIDHRGLFKNKGD